MNSFQRKPLPQGQLRFDLACVTVERHNGDRLQQVRGITFGAPPAGPNEPADRPLSRCVVDFQCVSSPDLRRSVVGNVMMPPTTANGNFK
jgi:hypothetical protein